MAGLAIQVIRPLAIHVGLGLAIVIGVSAPWSALVFANASLSPSIPWSLPIGLVYLSLVSTYLNGNGWPYSTSTFRRRFFRGRLPSPSVSLSALLAGFAGIAALWLLLAATGGLLLKQAPRPQFDVPPVFLVGAIILGAAVTALAEEAGLRGFMQASLETLIGPVAAIGMSSLVFVLIHLSHGVAALVRFGPLYLAAGCIYGLLAYLSQSIVPSLLLHFLGDLLLFGLRSSVVKLAIPSSDIAFVSLLFAAVVAAFVSAIGFLVLARLTAPMRPPTRSPGAK